MLHVVHGCAHWKAMTLMPNKREADLRSYSQLVAGWFQEFLALSMRPSPHVPPGFCRGPLPRPFILSGIPVLVFAWQQQIQMTSRYLRLAHPFQPFLPTFFLGGCFLLCPSLPLVLSNSKPTAIIILVISGLNPQKAAACPDFPQKPDQSQGSLGKLRQ